MYVTLVFIIVCILILILVTINVIQQYKKRKQAQIKMEVGRQKRVIEEVEAVLAHISGLPISNNIIMILYGRIEDALIAAKKVAQNNKYDQKLTNTRNQMQQLKAHPPKSITIENFQIPTDEKSIIAIVQILKTIKTILAAESQKGRIPHQVFSGENQKISHFQLRLNIENSVTRASGMVDQDRLSTAQQMLNKMQLTLESLEKKMPDDKYIQSKLAETKNLLEKIEEKEKAPKPAETTQPAQQETDKPAGTKEDDTIFGDRKKW